MANTTVGVDIKVKSEGANQAVGSFKKQLRDANEELIAMSEKFGATSNEAVNAAKRVANLKDAIGDAKTLSDAFNPDEKFKSMSGAIQGAVAGFSALQGAQALFGGESKELEATLLKVQAAMALSQGLNGIMAAKDSFIALGVVIKSNVVAAFSTLRGAIISTGIGALVVGIGLLIEQFSKLSDAAEEAAESQKKFAEETKKYADIGLKAELDSIKKQKDLAIAKAKLAGASEDEIFKIEQDYRARSIRAKIRYWEEVKKVDANAAEEIKKEIKNDNLDGQIAEINNQTRLKQIRDEARKKELDALKNQKKEEIKVKFTPDTADIPLPQDIIDEEAQKEANDRRIAEEQRVAQEISNASTLTADAIIKNELAKQAASDKTLADKKIKAEQEIMLMNLVGSTANAFAELVGKQTAVGKALSIASATINTYTAASEALKANYGIFGPAAQVARVLTVASVIATGLKQVREIARVKVPGGGAGGGGSIPTPSAGGVQPLNPVAQTTALNQSSINAIGNAAGRAFVLETDVSNNQERIRRLNRAARIN